MRSLLNFYFRSALCTILFKARRIPCSVVTCEGRRFPRVYHRGKVVIEGRLGIAGQLVSCELGAKRDAYLRLGNRVFLNNGASVIANHRIEIGDNTFLGEFVAIYDTNYHSIDPDHPVKFAPVIIGSNVWLARNVTVLPGSRIGDHTVVSAGSVVKGDLPPRVLAAGNPAVPVKDLLIPDGWLRSLLPGRIRPGGSAWAVDGGVGEAVRGAAAADPDRAERPEDFQVRGIARGQGAGEVLAREQCLAGKQLTAAGHAALADHDAATAADLGAVPVAALEEPQKLMTGAGIAR